MKHWINESLHLEAAISLLEILKERFLIGNIKDFKKIKDFKYG
jgi:hypothetical protein